MDSGPRYVKDPGSVPEGETKRIRTDRDPEP